MQATWLSWLGTIVRSGAATLEPCAPWRCCSLQGTYAPVGSGTERAVYTDAHGRFTVTSPALATYTFASTGASSCVDAVTGSALAFPHTVVLPPLANATITAISLLTVPARSDSALVAKYGSMAEVVPQELWTEVYGMFGHAASDKVRGLLRGWLCLSIQLCRLHMLPGSARATVAEYSANVYSICNGQTRNKCSNAYALSDMPCLSLSPATRSTSWRCLACPAPSLRA